MKKVEQFIQENTRNDSNICWDASLGYIPWLAPDDARKVAEIVREETIREVCEYIKDNLYKNLYVYNGVAGFPTFQFIEDLKKHLENKL